jgi:hypothetical protein
MSKVRVDYEDIFIKTFTRTEEIPEKYTFNFNSKWVENNSPTKKNMHKKNRSISYAFYCYNKF